jgi:ubiquinone biosynthesis protein
VAGEILYGLTTGNYRRVAEIHFEAQYVPSYHSVDEFATALRAVGEPMRGKPVSELSVGMMLDGLFAITRDFDMQTQPHLLLLQKTDGHGRGHRHHAPPRDQHVGRLGAYVRSWIRDELGQRPRSRTACATISARLLRLPALIRASRTASPRAAERPSSRRCRDRARVGARRAARGALAGLFSPRRSSVGRWCGWRRLPERSPEAC